jgi:hypothetical protein
MESVSSIAFPVERITLRMQYSDGTSFNIKPGTLYQKSGFIVPEPANEGFSGFIHANMLDIALQQHKNNHSPLGKEIWNLCSLLDNRSNP